MDEGLRCRSCNSSNLISFCDLGDQPYANSLLKTPDGVEKKFPLSLSYCQVCHLVQLQHTANPQELFSNYVWVTQTSTTARNHAETFCNQAMARLRSASVDSYVLELASNDGTFLRPFIKKGIDVLGVDPAENIVKQAIINNIPSKCAFFGVEIAHEIMQDKGRPDIVFARNVLPHVANLRDFVEGISYLIDNDNLAIIEFHYAKRILSELHYDSIYHEHLCYFTLKSIQTLLSQFGLNIIDITESPISGGSLVAYLRKGNVKPSNVVAKYFEEEEKQRVNQLQSWKNFSENVYLHRKQLLAMLKKELSLGNRIVGYGASARSSTLLNFCGIDSNMLSMIADKNPMKHGLFTAGTHIPILFPHEVLASKPDTILILSWNFLDEIISYLKSEFKFKGRIIAPLPNMPLLKII